MRPRPSWVKSEARDAKLRRRRMLGREPASRGLCRRDELALGIQGAGDEPVLRPRLRGSVSGTLRRAELWNRSWILSHQQARRHGAVQSLELRVVEAAVPELDATVFVVDDDASVLEDRGGLIRAAGLKVETYAPAHEFLARPPVDVPSCLVLDVGLP